MFFIITITCPLHVSAPSGHLQVEYIYCLLPKELFFYNGSVVLVWVINCIYVSFLFWRFFRCCQYVCGGYDCLLLLLHFSIYVITLKLITIN
jgi:hypothetical protein